MSREEPDYYQILQVAEDAEPEVIEAAYRRLARKYHPDVDKTAEATERMRTINAAFEVLGNARSRAQYDARRGRRGTEPRAHPPAEPAAEGRGHEPTPPRRKSILGIRGAAAVAVVAVLAALGMGFGGWALLRGGDGGEGTPTAPVADGSPVASPTGEAGLPAPCQALASLKSYRYVTEMRLESPEPEGTPSPDQPTPTTTITRDFTGPFLFKYDVEASFVAPDRLEAYVTGTSSPTSVIMIGDQKWLETGTAWREIAGEFNVTYGPLDVCKAVLPDLDLSQAQPQSEKRNDVDSLHYTFSQVPSDATAELFGPGSDMAILLGNLDVELWLAEEDNHLVRIEVQSTGLYADSRELRIHLVDDVTDANDDSIRVEPPI